MLPFPSDEKVTFSTLELFFIKILKASLALSSPGANWSTGVLVVKSIYPPLLIYSSPDLNKSPFLFIWVGRICVIGSSVSSANLNKYPNFLVPSPKWIFAIPDFPDNKPPTLDCAIAWINSSYVAWELLVSDIAISPIPIILSISIISFLIDPVSVFTGIS